MDTIDIIFKLLGGVLAVGGTAAAIAYGVFVFLGKKWIETKFAESLEAYKHKQNKELEEVRYRINAQFNRITKIHEKEIEILPLAWSKLNNALGKITYLTSPMRQYQDLDKLTKEQLEAFLAKSTFSDWEKSELQKKEDKLDYYQERIFYHELSDAKTASVDFHNYILDNSIFLSRDIKDKFITLDDILWGAITDKAREHESEYRTLQLKTFTEIQQEIKPIKEEIESLVQKRLQLDQAI